MTERMQSGSDDMTETARSKGYADSVGLDDEERVVRVLLRVGARPLGRRQQPQSNWYDDLDPEQQQVVRDRVQTWMDQHGVVPAAGQSARDLVLETASERWAALTPAERQQWLDQRRARIEQRRATASASHLTSDQRAVLSERAANLSPEQRAALRESAQGTSFDRVSGRGAPSGIHRSISNHPTPGRAGLSGGTRFHATRGSGRGGQGRGR